MNIFISYRRFFTALSLLACASIPATAMAAGHRLAVHSPLAGDDEFASNEKVSDNDLDGMRGGFSADGITLNYFTYSAATTTTLPGLLPTTNNTSYSYVASANPPASMANITQLVSQKINIIQPGAQVSVQQVINLGLTTSLNLQSFLHNIALVQSRQFGR